MKKYIDSSKIKHEIKLFAKTLNSEYKQKDVVIVGVLKGCICFLSDLIRELNFNFSIEFVQAQSYGMKGDVAQDTVIQPFDFNVNDQDVILLDDIFDRGATLHSIYQKLLKAGAKSIKTVVLLKKKTNNLCEFKPDHYLFEIENKFVIGYGLDYKEKYRGLKSIYSMLFLCFFFLSKSLSL